MFSNFCTIKYFVFFAWLKNTMRPPNQAPAGFSKQKGNAR